MCVVFLALQYFLPVLAACHVIILSVNTMTMFFLNNQGGTKSLKSLHFNDKIPNLISSLTNDGEGSSPSRVE